MAQYQPLSSLFSTPADAANPFVGTPPSKGLLGTTLAKNISFPKGGMSVNTAMGQKAKNPADNITSPINTLTPQQKSDNAAYLTDSVSTIAGANKPATPVAPTGGYAVNNQGAGDATNAALATAQAQSPGGSQYVPPVPSSNTVFNKSASNLANTTPNTETTQAQTNLNNQATGANPAQGNINTLTDIGLYGSPQIQQAMQQQQGLLKSQEAISSDPNMLAAVDSGRAQAAQTSINSAAQFLNAAEQQQANQISAANSAGGQQLTGQSQQIGAANNAGNLANIAQGNQIGAQYNAGSLTQPTAGATFFGSNETGGIVGAGNGLIQTAIQNALQTGGDPTTQRANLVASYGPLAGTAFDSAKLAQSNGTYNPTNQSASAQQTATQGAATGGEAYNLGIALKQVDTLKPVISNFLSISGINPTDSKLYNAPISDYLSKLGNPAATQQYNTMLNDLQNFSSQIVSSGTALTPTGVTAATELQDPSGLSMSQINYYMGTLADLGQNRYSVLTDAARASGYTGYTGGATGVTTSTPVSPPSNSPGSGVTSPAGQAAAGVGLGVGSWALNTAKNIGPEMVSYLAGIFSK